MPPVDGWMDRYVCVCVCVCVCVHVSVFICFFPQKTCMMCLRRFGEARGSGSVGGLLLVCCSDE